MAKNLADKILDAIGKLSLIKPDRPLSELTPWNRKEVERKDELTNYRGFHERNKKSNQLTRENTEGIWDTIAQWFGKSAPYTRPTGPGRDDPNQTYPTRAGYKY